MRTLPLIALLSLACSETTGPDAGKDAGIDGGIDASEPIDTGFDSGLEPNRCDDLGLRRIPLKPGSGRYEFGEVAGDFRLTELSSRTFSLADTWTGCDSFVFVSYIRTTSSFPKYEDRFWGSSPQSMIDNAPANTHFFFLSFEPDPSARQTRMLETKSRVEAIAGGPDDRFHYVVDHPFDIEGSISGFFEDYFNYLADQDSWADLGDRGRAPPPLPWVFGIDRDQEWDSGGSADEVVGGGPSFQIASWLPAFYDHKARIRDAHQAEIDVETVVLLEGTVTERVFTRGATLPPDLSGFDSMEVDVTVDCKERNVFNCSEWDRIARVSLCTNSDCSEREEVVRWITPYWRVGERRWVMDASALFGMLSPGPQTFHVEMGPSWERATPRDVRIQLRLFNKSRGVRSSGVTYAFGGGTFDDTYNVRTPVEFTPPTSAKRVSLVVILSGHGQEQGNNCAEWCDHRHQFAVNGANLDVIRHEGSIGSRAGCAPAAQRGVPPGQFGNWAPERAFWCPGLPVDHIERDITSRVTLGASNTLTYEATFGNVPPSGGNISMSTYIVWYE